MYSFVNKVPNIQANPNRDRSKPMPKEEVKELDRFFISQVPDLFNKKMGLFDSEDRPDFYRSVLSNKASAFSASSTACCLNSFV